MRTSLDIFSLVGDNGQRMLCMCVCGGATLLTECEGGRSNSLYLQIFRVRQVRSSMPRTQIFLKCLVVMNTFIS